MNILALIEQVLLSFILALLLPVTVYWGVKTFYFPIVDTVNNAIIVSTDKLDDRQEAIAKAVQSTFKHTLFYCAIVIGSLALVVGMFTPILHIAIGLIGGGILNIIMAMFFISSAPLLNFIIFLLLLIILICLMFKRTRK